LLLFLPEGLKNPFQDAVFCPPVDSYTDGMPGAEGPGEGTPFTAVLADIDYGVKKAAVIDFHVSPLFGKKVHNFFSLFPG
jgi:hypothetical protein